MRRHRQQQLRPLLAEKLPCEPGHYAGKRCCSSVTRAAPPPALQTVLSPAGEDWQPSGQPGRSLQPVVRCKEGVVEPSFVQWERPVHPPPPLLLPLPPHQLGGGGSALPILSSTTCNGGRTWERERICSSRSNSPCTVQRPCSTGHCPERSAAWPADNCHQARPPLPLRLPQPIQLPALILLPPPLV